MFIKDIFIELRARLRSCNVYITTGVDLNKNCNLKINIQSNCIALNYYNNSVNLKRTDSLSSIESLSDCYSDDESEDVSVIQLGEFCHIIPNSMSCLKIDTNTISFRILTEPKNGGNFYAEFLPANDHAGCAKKNHLMINLKANNDTKIVCGNCSNVVSDNGVTFDRILELPTTNMDMSEWFCHGHGHGHGHEHGHGHGHEHGHGHGAIAQHVMPKPSKNDFLYRLTYFVVNNGVLSEKTNRFNAKRDAFHCDRCLAWLGLKDGGSVKLFNSEVRMRQDDADARIFLHNTQSVYSLSVDDFIYTIECMTRESNLGMQYSVMCKIVLECAMSSTNKQYLLIWIMDKELQVLRNSEGNTDSEKIILQSSLLTKILYKIETCLNDEVETWLSDPTVVSTEISRSMFFRGVEHLQLMSQKFPEAFRSANGYNISYLKV